LLSSGAMAQSGSNVTITDASHDVLKLLNVTTATVINDASMFKFA
jgi:hypothetical protein